MRRAWVLVPVLLLAGCGGGGGSTTSESGAVIKTVPIAEKEFSLTPGNVNLTTAGTYEFKVTNDGQITHAFNIEGKGLEEQETGDIDPGQSKTLRVTLSQGSFEMYCPIDGHKQQGMKGTITVGSPAAGKSGGQTTPETETKTTTQTTTGATTTRPGY